MNDDLLQPVQTPLGMAYPPPKVRDLIFGIENVQKRMVSLQMQINGLGHTPKKIRETRRQTLETEMAGLNAELLALQEQLGKHPLEPQHFKHPNRPITRCCKEYPMPTLNPQDANVIKEETQYRCPSCGKDPAETYKRVDEEWTEDEKEKKPHWSDKLGKNHGDEPPSLSDKPFLAYVR